VQNRVICARCGHYLGLPRDRKYSAIGAAESRCCGCLPLPVLVMWLRAVWVLSPSRKCPAPMAPV